MTGLHDTSPDRDANARDFHREQLSAMLDGALSADETRFLLRRMQHDDELADCWGRWQFYGDALRGHAGRALPADFSQRVGRAIANDTADDIAIGAVEPRAASAHAARRSMTAGSVLQRPLLRWGGGAALAASVALAAFLGGRESASVPTGPIPSTAVVIDPAGAQPGAPVPMSIAATPPVPLPVPEPHAPAGDGMAPAAVLVASAAAAAAAAESRGAHPRIKAASRAASSERNRLAVRATVPAPTREAVAPSFASARTPEAGDFSPDAIVAKPIVAKPWPRALVPGAAGNGTVTAGLDDDTQGLHPVFQPRPQPRFELPPPASSVATPP